MGNEKTQGLRGEVDRHEVPGYVAKVNALFKLIENLIRQVFHRPAQVESVHAVVIGCIAVPLVDLPAPLVDAPPESNRRHLSVDERDLRERQREEVSFLCQK